jgi:hypothetical protein
MRCETEPATLAIAPPAAAARTAQTATAASSCAPDPATPPTHQLLGPEDLDVSPAHVRLVLLDGGLHVRGAAQQHVRFARKPSVPFAQEDVDRLQRLQRNGGWWKSVFEAAERLLEGLLPASQRSGLLAC